MIKVKIMVTNENGEGIESYYIFENLNKTMYEVLKEIDKHGLRDLVEKEGMIE